MNQDPTLLLDPDTIQPYVAIGPTSDISVTVHKSTFDGLVVAVMIIFMIFVVIVVIVLMVVARNHVRPQALSDTIVIAPNLSVAKFGIFNVLPNLANKKVNKTSEQPDLHSAAQWATLHAKQQAWSFHYHQRLAVIWDITTSEQAATEHEPDILYAASVSPRWFLDSVFLAEFPESIPRSYWKYKERDRYLYLKSGEVHQISWKANVIGGDRSLTGIYANHPFSVEDVPLILSRPPQGNCRIYPPDPEGKKIRLPDWSEYWVCYVKI